MSLYSKYEDCRELSQRTPEPGTTAVHMARVLAQWQKRIERANAKPQVSGARPPPWRWRHDWLLILLWTDAQVDPAACRCPYCIWGRVVPLLVEARRDPIHLKRRRPERVS